MTGNLDNRAFFNAFRTSYYRVMAESPQTIDRAFPGDLRRISDAEKIDMIYLDVLSGNNGTIRAKVLDSGPHAGMLILEERVDQGYQQIPKVAPAELMTSEDMVYYRIKRCEP